MSSSMPSESSSSNSTSLSSSSMPARTSSSYSNASTSSPRDVVHSPPNSRASSSISMLNHAPTFMSRSSISSLGQGDIHAASTSMAASSSLPHPFSGAGSREDKRRKVVGISIPKGSMATKEDFFQDKFLSGDIVERVTGSEDEHFTSPFTAGKRGLLEELHNFHETGVSILTIQVKRGERKIIRRALIVPGKKKKYVLQDFEDPSHVFSFDDFTLENCSTLQDHALRLAEEQLSKMRVAAVDVAYPWEQKMQNVSGLGMVYSMLVVPRAHADVRMPQSSTLEDAVLQAITWLHGSKDSGVPLIFRSIQTEPIIAEDAEQSSFVDLSSIVSSGTYSLQQPQGFTDRRLVIRAVRIWFAFPVTEVKVELKAKQGEGMLGVTIGRTVEGFCYVADVVPETAADRAGLKERLDVGLVLGMKLVVTKVGNERILPWFMSNGSIRCYDNNSISSKLSAHRRAGQAACLHLLDITDTDYPMESQRLRLLMTSSCGAEGNVGSYMEL